MALYHRLSKTWGQLRGIHSFETRLNGFPLHFYAKQGLGGGPPALLLHGLGASGLAFFRVFPSLAKQLRAVYALDFPGFGLSPLPPKGPLSLEAMVELTQNFLADEVKTPAFLFGNSLGGALAAQVASQTPQLVQALCLWAPAGAPMCPEEALGFSKLFEVQHARHARALLRRMFARTPWYAEWFASGVVPMLNVPAVRFVAQNCTQRFLEPHTLQALHMPTLLVWGTLEKLLPPKGIDYFRQHLPKGATVLEVQGFGHMPQWESPGKCMRLWWEFIRKQGLV